MTDESLSPQVATKLLLGRIKFFRLEKDSAELKSHDEDLRLELSYTENINPPQSASTLLQDHWLDKNVGTYTDTTNVVIKRKKKIFIILRNVSTAVISVYLTLTPWLMEPGGSMPHSQGLSNNSYPEPNQPNYPH